MVQTSLSPAKERYEQLSAEHPSKSDAISMLKSLVQGQFRDMRDCANKCAKQVAGTLPPGLAGKRPVIASSFDKAFAAQNPNARQQALKDKAEEYFGCLQRERCGEACA